MSEDMLEIDGQQVSLADIAGINMDDVAEVRSTVTAAGAMQFKVKEMKLDTVDTQKGTKAVVNVALEITNVITLLDDTLNAEDIIGKTHNETFWITNPVDDIGRVKAFMTDSGFQGSGTLQELMEGFTDHEFLGVIKHKRDKNDADKIYANLDRGKGKVQPLPVPDAA